jgi:hypothetical protein
MVVRSSAELLRRYREVFNDNVVRAMKAQEPDTPVRELAGP